MGLWAVMAKAADRQHDQSRVQRLKLGWSEAEPFDDAGSEVLDQNVCRPQQSLKRQTA